LTVVAEIDCNAGGDVSLVYSTFLGGTGTDAGNGIAVDVWGNAYVTGVSGDSDGPTHTLQHAFVAEDQPGSGQSLIWGLFRRQRR